MGDSIRAGVYTRGHKLRLAFLLLALLPIVANGVIAFVSLRDLARSNAETERSLEAILLLERVGDLVQDSARDQRAYRVYGDPLALDAYRKARAKLPEKLERLARPDDGGRQRSRPVRASVGTDWAGHRGVGSIAGTD